MTEQLDGAFDDEGGTRGADVPGGILVGHDGSVCAQEALQGAGRLAVPAGSRPPVARSAVVPGPASSRTR